VSGEIPHGTGPKATGNSPDEGNIVIKGRVFEGRYRVGQRLGTGGVGEVYQAEHLRLGRQVAFKVLRPAYASSKKLRMRFVREAQALSVMAHPNIVAVHDFGVAHGMPYLVMELLRGQTLSQRFKGPLIPLDQTLSISAQVLRGLVFAHQQGLVHRDLKPGNIFLEPLGGDALHVRILDFGLAKFVAAEEERNGPQLTLTGMVFGTPAYMAPEQAIGAELDGRADLYALGVVLFEMLTGVRLFTGQREEQMRQQVTSIPPTLAEACPGLPFSQPLEEFVQRALAKERGDRFQDAQEMLSALQRLQTSELSLRYMQGPETVQVGAVSPRESSAQPFDSKLLLAEFQSTCLTLIRHVAKGEKRTIAAVAAAFGLLMGLAGACPLSRCGQDPAPPPPVASGDGVSSSARTVAVTNPATQPASGDQSSPWDIREIPAPFMRARIILAQGAGLPADLAAELRDEVTRRPGDARPLLLLAQDCIHRGPSPECLATYELAHTADERARHDPRMLSDLIELVQVQEVGPAAADLVVQIYGHNALEAVIQALAAPDQDRAARRRLETLRQRLNEAGD
jgi:serine/threonine-protein kinase